MDHLKLVCQEGGYTLVPVYLQNNQEHHPVINVGDNTLWGLVLVVMCVAVLFLPQEVQFLDVCRGVCQTCHIFVALLGATSDE